MATATYTLDEVHSIYKRIKRVVCLPQTDEAYGNMLNEYESAQAGLAEALDTMCCSAQRLHYNQNDAKAQLVLNFFNA